MATSGTRRSWAVLAARLGAVAAFAVAVVVAPPPAGAAAPANDAFAAARPLGTASTGRATGATIGATKEAGEPDHAGNPGGHSVWFLWTSTVNGNESFSTEGSDFDTVLGVYTGASVGALTPVASNDDLGSEPHAVVSFRVTAATTYAIAVDGFTGKDGVITLTWAPAPANDNFADRQVLPSTTTGSTRGTTRGATREPGEPQSEVAVGRIWYSWTAPASGTFRFDTFGSLVDTVLGVYKGSALDALTEIGINDDDPDRGCCSSWVPLTGVTAGTTYSILIAPLDDSADDGANAGRLTLRWAPLILGTAGSDRLVGTGRADEIRGGSGNDVILGRSGDDVIFGGRGNDTLRGGPGRDQLVDHRGHNRLFGNAGADLLDARGGRADLLNGGHGRDRCLGNRNDTRRLCP